MDNEDLNALYYEISKDLPADKQAGLYKLHNGYEAQKKKLKEDMQAHYINAAAFGLIPIVAYYTFRFYNASPAGDFISCFMVAMLMSLLPFMIYFAAYIFCFKNAGKIEKAVLTVFAVAIAAYLAHGIQI